MKKTIAISVVSFIISLVSLFISFTRSEYVVIEWASVLVGIMSLLVACLFGWQLINYVQIKNDIKKLIDKSIEESFSDFNSILKGFIIMLKSNAFLMREMPQALDENMVALESILQSKNEEMMKYSLDIIMEYMLEIKKDMEGCERVQIFKNRKSKYLYLLNKVNHHVSNDIIEMINHAEEVEDNTDKFIRIYKLGSGDPEKLRSKGIIK